MAVEADFICYVVLCTESFRRCSLRLQFAAIYCEYECFISHRQTDRETTDRRTGDDV